MRVTLVAVAMAALAIASSGETVAADTTCTLSDRDLAANALLAFDEFDQKGVTPATARALGRRGCDAEAARATQHYLIHGPLNSHGQQVILTFHLAQYLESIADARARSRKFGKMAKGVFAEKLRQREF